MRGCKTHETLKSPVYQGFFVASESLFEPMVRIIGVYLSEWPLHGASPNERAEAVTASTLAGEISPTAASELMAVLSAQARIAEVSELAERLERIENALKLEGSKKEQHRPVVSVRRAQAT